MSDDLDKATGLVNSSRLLLQEAVDAMERAMEEIERLRAQLPSEIDGASDERDMEGRPGGSDAGDSDLGVRESVPSPAVGDACGEPAGVESPE